MSTTLQMTQGHSSGTPEQATQLPTHLSHENPTPPPTKRGGGEQYSEEPISRSQRDKSPPLQPTKKGGGEQYSEEPTSTEPTSEQGARERHRRPASCLKEPHRATSSNSEDTERKGNSFHICLPGQAWPTLPLMRYRVGMDVDDPTNDPRPLFRHTRTSNSVTNPPFTRKSNPSPHQKGRR